MKGSKTDINSLRKCIDDIDDSILDALNKRAELVLNIAELKRGRNEKFYVPAREKEIISRLLNKNSGPLPSSAVKSIFREIMSASLSMEEPITVACLGPLGTFTHLAAIRHFGSSSDMRPLSSIKAVFESVEMGESRFGVVPIENSNEGVVNYTLDMFMDYDLMINAEIMLEVSHNLMSLSGKMKSIMKVYSHPQTSAQCRRWLETNMPGIPVLETASNARSAELASKDGQSAAISSELAAGIYGLKFVQRHIEDNRKNVTRFLVIGKDPSGKTGNDKTSIMFSIKDRPGALYGILTPFKKAKVNLTKIESRPSKRKAWEYIFFIDMQGHAEDSNVKRAIAEMKAESLYFKILGSYPCGE